MADTLLHGLIYAEWESLKFAKPPATTEDEDEMDGIESGDDDEEVGIDVRNLSDPSSGSSIEKLKSKEVGGKGGKGRKKVNIHGHGGIEVSRKHDLNDIARAGGGGKVMYMFEKVSKSKM
jgi:hypothetical protein